MMVRGVEKEKITSTTASIAAGGGDLPRRSYRPVVVKCNLVVHRSSLAIVAAGNSK